MTVTFDYTGRVALITGSSSGIGAATAIMFAGSGAQVVVTGRNAEKVRNVSKECDKVSPKGLKALQVVADLTNKDDAKRLVDTTIEKLGKIDVLVNGVGISIPCSIRDPNYMKVYEQVFETNLVSIVYMTHLTAKLLGQSKGNIINISSFASTQAMENNSPYCMTKSAIDMFTKCMCIELGPLGVRVNAVNPGYISTEAMKPPGMEKEKWDQILRDYGSKLPVGRVGQPNDIANMILFLASDASSFTTGSIVAVDGGHLAASAKIKPSVLYGENYRDVVKSK